MKCEVDINQYMYLEGQKQAFLLFALFWCFISVVE